MSRPALPLLLVACTATILLVGCQYTRKMFARREPPPDAVVVRDRDEALALGEPERPAKDDGATELAKADDGRTERSTRAIDDEFAASMEGDAPGEKPRSRWPNLLRPFQPLRAIPVPRSDLSEAEADEAPAKEAKGDEFDPLGGF